MFFFDGVADENGDEEREARRVGMLLFCLASRYCYVSGILICSGEKHVVELLFVPSSSSQCCLHRRGAFLVDQADSWLLDGERLNGEVARHGEIARSWRG